MEVMKLIVFGATGKTGQHVWKHGLEQGHEVTAFTRSPVKIDPNAGARIAQGDVTDPDAVAEAIASHDAAIVALGPNGLRDRTTLTTGTRNVVDGMKRHGVTRLVVLSAAGAGESWGQVPLLSRVAFRTFLRTILAEHTAQEAIARESPLDWTLVRAGVLNDEPASGDVVATNKGKITRIGRADLGAFLVREVTEGAYSRQAISVTS
ncbi:MAG: SDR family oxidoreductase [Dehalococcoidia bacterium]|nr:SDR family oxidoreductase [Dehalococcoidia bacterium]MYD28139.1 SDR family oxidoreductase [Dehalococcoidia bacterium]